MSPSLLEESRPKIKDSQYVKIRRSDIKMSILITAYKITLSRTSVILLTNLNAKPLNYF